MGAHAGRVGVLIYILAWLAQNPRDAACVVTEAPEHCCSYSLPGTVSLDMRDDLIFAGSGEKFTTLRVGGGDKITLVGDINLNGASKWHVEASRISGTTVISLVFFQAEVRLVSFLSTGSAPSSLLSSTKVQDATEALECYDIEESFTRPVVYTCCHSKRFTAVNTDSGVATEVPLKSDCYSLSLNGGSLYVATKNDGVLIFDVSDASSPPLESTKYIPIDRAVVSLHQTLGLLTVFGKNGGKASLQTVDPTTLAVVAEVTPDVQAPSMQGVEVAFSLFHSAVVSADRGIARWFDINHAGAVAEERDAPTSPGGSWGELLTTHELNSFTLHRRWLAVSHGSSLEVYRLGNPSTDAPPTPSPTETPPTPGTAAPAGGPGANATEVPATPAPPADTPGPDATPLPPRGTPAPGVAGAASWPPGAGGTSTPMPWGVVGSPAPSAVPEDVQEGLRRLEEVEQAATAAGNAATVGALFEGSSAGPALRLLMVGRHCREGARVWDTSYPLTFHPTQWTILGTQAAGAVVGNSLITVSFWIVMSVSMLLLRGTHLARTLTTLGLFRFPSAPLFVFQFLLQGTTLGAMELILYMPSIASFLIGFASLIFCLVVPTVLLLKVAQCVPNRAYFAADPLTERHVWLTFLIGAGEWVSTCPTELWALRYKSALTPYREKWACFSFVEMLGNITLAALQATHADSSVGCGHKKLTLGCVFLILLFLEMYTTPRARARDLYLSVTILSLQAGAMFFMSAGYYKSDINHWCFYVAPPLLLLSVALIFIKLGLDCISEAYIVYTGRRSRLQAEASTRHVDEELNRGGSIILPRAEGEPAAEVCDSAGLAAGGGAAAAAGSGLTSDPDTLLELQGFPSLVIERTESFQVGGSVLSPVLTPQASLLSQQLPSSRRKSSQVMLAESGVQGEATTLWQRREAMRRCNSALAGGGGGGGEPPAGWRRGFGGSSSDVLPPIRRDSVASAAAVGDAALPRSATNIDTLLTSLLSPTSQGLHDSFGSTGGGGGSGNSLVPTPRRASFSMMMGDEGPKERVPSLVAGVMSRSRVYDAL